MKINCLILLIYFPFYCLGNEDSLQIERFMTRSGVLKTDSLWNPVDEITLPMPPSFISITLKSSSIEPANYICFLADTVRIYDTLYMGNNPTINFFNLPGGAYTAKFVNLKNNESAIKKFSIESPFYEKWWFPPLILLLLTILIGSIFYFIYKIQLRQKLRTQRIRDNIARDLHDDIGSYLSSISIMSQNVDLMLTHNPEKARTSLTKIGDTAREVMDTMGDIVWSINPNHDAMPQVIQKMQDLASELFGGQNIETVFYADEQIKDMSLTLDKRRDFFLLYKEAVTNISKYARATRVEVSIRKENQEVILSIKDNGVGFEYTTPLKPRSNGGNGLKNMALRAKKLGGTLNIESTAGGGTCVQLRFQVG